MLRVQKMRLKQSFTRNLKKVNMYSTDFCLFYSFSTCFFLCSVLFFIQFIIIYLYEFYDMVAG